MLLPGLSWASPKLLWILVGHGANSTSYPWLRPNSISGQGLVGIVTANPLCSHRLLFMGTTANILQALAAPWSASLLCRCSVPSSLLSSVHVSSVSAVFPTVKHFPVHCLIWSSKWTSSEHELLLFPYYKSGNCIPESQDFSKATWWLRDGPWIQTQVLLLKPKLFQ